ncbi:YoaK family protein [Mycobacterium gastri]
MLPQTEPSGLTPKGLILGYSGLLAMVAGFVNAVALLVLAFPVGNLTGVTTQLGMDTANPWLYEGHVLSAILLGFLAGTAAAGAILARTDAHTGPRHAAVLIIEAVFLLLAALGVEETAVKAEIAAAGIERAVVQALFAAAALGLQNGLTSNTPGMAIRTTHFTGTVTDLGLMIGRSRRHGIDRWKAAVLTVTLLLFLTGGVAGILTGAWLAGYALLLPAAVCVAVAIIGLVHGRGRPASPSGTNPQPSQNMATDDRRFR